MVGRARRERTKSKRSLSRELAGAGAKEKAPPGGPRQGSGSGAPRLPAGLAVPRFLPRAGTKAQLVGTPRSSQAASSGPARDGEGDGGAEGAPGAGGVPDPGPVLGSDRGSRLTSVGLDLLVLKQSNDPSLTRRRCAPAGRGPGQRTPPRGSLAEAQTRGPTPPAARGRSPAEAPARRPLPHGRAGGAGCPPGDAL